MRNNNRTQRVNENLNNSSFCDDYLYYSNLEIEMDKEQNNYPTDVTIGCFALKHSKPSSISLEENLDIDSKNEERIKNSFLPKDFYQDNIVNKKSSIKYLISKNTNTISF